MTSSDSEDLMICEGETLNVLGDEVMKLEVKTNPSQFQIREYMNDIVIYGRGTKVGGKVNLNYLN